MPTVIPIFLKKVEGVVPFRLDISVKPLYTDRTMNQETLLVALFFTFMIGAGVGFYLARVIF